MPACLRRAAWLCLALLSLHLSPAALARQGAPDGAVVARVEIRGLTTLNEEFVLRVVQTRAGQNFTRDQLQEDIRELLRTRKFLNVVGDSQLTAEGVLVLITVQEKPEIASVQIEGNKEISTDDLFKELTIAPGAPLDTFEIGRAREDIERQYKEKGFYFAEVTLDELLLQEERRVLIRVVEGPRVRVRRIAFEGNTTFPEPTLSQQLQSQTYFPILRTGAFDPEQADRDALELQSFFRGEGFLDARAGYRLDFDSVERTDLTLTFVIEEGARYRAEEVILRGMEVFDEAALRESIKLQPGDLAREEVIRADVKAIQDRYGEIGFVDARVERSFEFTEEPAVVKLVYEITESTRSTIGRITIRGNPYTKDEVIRRELRFYPGEDFNTLKVRGAEQRLRELNLFSKATVTPLADIEGVREALVEVEESEKVNNIGFGAGISSDSGLFGNISFENRNFDLFDWPRDFNELFRGRAFRGDGQRLRVSFEPGTEVTYFQIDFTEPYLFDQPLRFDLSAYLFSRERDGYEEQRLGIRPGLSRRFESGLLEGWSIEGTLRAELIDINDVDALAARDIREVRGQSSLTSAKFTIVRDRTDSRVEPSEGYRALASWEQAFGDYSFGKATAGVTWYKTMSTDLLDRKSILALRAETGYIVGDAPVFERFYAGGLGTMRGFSFRGISPRKGLYDNRVGGDFLLLTSGEYSIPLYSKNVRGFAFLDMGTVEEDLSISSWRAAVGFGVRITVPALGPTPIVLNFGFPVLREEEDNDQIFSFSFGWSF